MVSAALAAMLLLGLLALPAGAENVGYPTWVNAGSAVVEKNGGVYVMNVEDKNKVEFSFDKARLEAPVTLRVLDISGEFYENVTLIPIVAEPDCKIAFPSFVYDEEDGPEGAIGHFWSNHYTDMGNGVGMIEGMAEWWFYDEKLSENVVIQDDTYISTFMAADVWYWVKLADGKEPAEDTVAGFSDVRPGDYYAEAVKWAKETNVTDGTTPTTFSPASTVVRADAITFLWRAAGRPDPKTTVSPFTDVTDPSAYYYKPVLWAAEEGITNGVTSTRFGLRGTLTYDHILAFLCRAAGGAAVGPDWSDDAVAWARENGLTDGLSFSAKEPCPRSDVVYCLWKQRTGPTKPIETSGTGVTLQSKLNWKGALNVADHSVSRPLTGYSKGYYAISNGDGTLSGLIVNSSDEFYVERYDAQGNVVSSKALPMELPIFGAFLDGGDCFYLAFGQMNQEMDDSKEVWRIVQYDREWNKVGSVSVTGGESYAKEPYRSAVARMAVSEDGGTVTLYAARTRYDGHQSNITISMDTKPFSIQKIMGERFPSNHVSHSFGQFIRYDGGSMVTVDHGDAYPRSFVLQKGGKKLDLLKIAGSTGQNVTHAIGSGFEVSGDGYLFLGCSAPQKDFAAEDKAPWQVFLACSGKDLGSAKLTWLTSGSESIDTARLVKLDDGTFLVMWEQSDGIHYLTVDGKGAAVSQEQILKGANMPTTQPVVEGDRVSWIGVDRDHAAIYSIEA